MISLRVNYIMLYFSVRFQLLKYLLVVYYRHIMYIRIHIKTAYTFAYVFIQTWKHSSFYIAACHLQSYHWNKHQYVLCDNGNTSVHYLRALSEKLEVVRVYVRI